MRTVRERRYCRGKVSQFEDVWQAAEECGDYQNDSDQFNVLPNRNIRFHELRHQVFSAEGANGLLIT